MAIPQISLRPVSCSLSLMLLYLVGVIVCIPPQDGASWFNLAAASGRPLSAAEPLVNRFVDVLMTGFCGSLLLSVCALSFLKGRSQNLQQRNADIVASTSLTCATATHALCACDLSVTLQYDSAFSGTPVMIRPLKMFELICIVPCMGLLLADLGRELRLLPATRVAANVACDVMALSSLLVLACGAWSQALYFGSLISFFLFIRIPMDSIKTAFQGSCKASDENTRAVMRVLPSMILLFWPGAILLFCNLAGVIDAAAAEAASGALITAGICYFFFLWSARNSEEASARLTMELRKVEQKSSAADARNDAKRSFMRYIFHELRVPLNALALGLQDSAETAAEALNALLGTNATRVDSVPSLDSGALEGSTGISLRDYTGIHIGDGRPPASADPATSEPSTRSSTSTASTPITADPAASNTGSEPIPPPTRPVAAAPAAPAVASNHFLAVGSPAVESARPPQSPVLTADALHANISSIADTTQLLIGNAKAMGKLLDDFLSLEKIEEGKFEIEPVQFRVRGMVDDAVRMFTAPCAAKGLTLAVDADSTVQSTICGDVHKLRQVLCNYISNAIKFSPHGATITVSIAHGIDDHQVECVTVAVADNGVGISKEDQAKLFQPFNQIKAGALQKGNGTGLGLSICKRIVELSGGIVGCESSEGKGSRFFFQVPVDGPPSASSPTATDPAPTVWSPIDYIPSSHVADQKPSRVGSVSAASGIIDSSAVTVARTASRRGSASSFRVPARQSTARVSPCVTPSPAQSPQRPHVALTVTTGQYLSEPAPSHTTVAVFGSRRGHDTDSTRHSRHSRAALIGDASPAWAASSNPSMRGGRAASDSDATDESLRSVVSPAQVFPETYWSRAPVGPCVLLTHAVVVDDVKSNRDLFGRMLARRGVTTIHYAGDGLEAVALLDNLLDADLAKIQCWFTDKEMPNCDGHELSQHLRARGITAPIFGVTGNALAEDRRLFIAAGVDAVITKPVSMDSVESALLQHGLRLLPAPAASGHSSQATTPRPDGREHL